MKKLFLSLAFLMLTSLAMAQSTNILSPAYQSSANSPITYGGNVGINFTTYGLSLDLSPRIGYKITNDLELALNINGSLQHTEYYRSLSLGVGPSLAYYIGRAAYLSSSFQHYFVSLKNKSTSYTHNTEEDALYLGGGYMQQLGNNIYLQIGASYNVLYKKDKSIFSSGLVPHVGIVIGL